MSTRSRIFVLLCMIAAAVLMAKAAPDLLQSLYDNFLKSYGGKPGDKPEFNTGSPLYAFAFGVMGIVIGAGIGNLFIRIGDGMDRRWSKMDSGDKVTLFVGIFFGLIASVPFLLLLNSLRLGVYIPFAITGITLGFAALSVYALQSMEDWLPWTKGRASTRRRGIKILDTNVIIDGRIYDVIRTGFLEGQLYVPGFVLEELQHIADSQDTLRRQRGRRGLEVLRLMDADFNLEVRVHDKLAPEKEQVDQRLVKIARALGADIVTNDFNLNQIASVEGVKVLNINDLALGLRPNLLPGETLMVSIIREGNQFGQGVGYLDDGTMIVVENGREHVGETLNVVITQVIQTERGKMMFAEVPNGEKPEDVMRRKPTYHREPRR